MRPCNIQLQLNDIAVCGTTCCWEQTSFEQKNFQRIAYLPISRVTSAANTSSKRYYCTSWLMRLCKSQRLNHIPLFSCKLKGSHDFQGQDNLKVPLWNPTHTCLRTTFASAYHHGTLQYGHTFPFAFIDVNCWNLAWTHEAHRDSIIRCERLRDVDMDFFSKRHHSLTSSKAQPKLAIQVDLVITTSVETSASFPMQDARSQCRKYRGFDMFHSRISFIVRLVQPIRLPFCIALFKNMKVFSSERGIKRWQSQN